MTGAFATVGRAFDVASPDVPTLAPVSVVTELQRRLVRRRRRRSSAVPRHVGVIIDGNRRWARAAGYTSATVGHRTGAQHITDLITWADDAGIEHLTVYVVSADNLRKRDSDEIQGLHDIIRTVLPEVVVDADDWQLHLSGDLSLLPHDVTTALHDARERTLGRPHHLTLAIGYDGRQDIVDAVRTALLREADSASIAALDADRITTGLGGGPVKDIDLVIRTSGEQRLSGFCPWQVEHAEIAVSPKMWPAFARRDFAAALRQYAESEQRRRDGD